MSRLRLIMCASLAALLLFILVSAAFASAKLEMEEEKVPVPTEAEVKAMKVKDLKVFLSDRGLPCESCSEKGDFVKAALKGREAPLLASKRKLKPKGEFWEHWSRLGVSLCEEAAKKKKVKPEDAGCANIGVAVDSYFMQHGKRTAAKLKKTTAAMLKTSAGEPYGEAGSRLLNKIVAHCVKTPAACNSESKVAELLQNDKIKGVDMGKWITNVGIENTNPMYEAIKDKKLNSDL